jgi:hypothetical protein
VSLKALASQTLARLHGTEAGTALEHVEQADSCSKAIDLCSSHLEHGFPQKSAINGTCSTVPLSRDGTVGTSLPAELRLGLKRLRLMSPPRIVRAQTWSSIVASGLLIATEGWASQALALGWEPLHLFGYQPSDDPDEFGLAVELAGREIKAVDEQRFYLRDGDVRSFFENRPRPLLTKFLWDLDL